MVYTIPHYDAIRRGNIKSLCEVADSAAMQTLETLRAYLIDAMGGDVSPRETSEGLAGSGRVLAC